MKLQLKPIQEEAINKLRQEWGKNRTHLIMAPCGFGKTALAAYIINGFQSKGMRVIFTVPYTSLIMQTVERFEQYGLPKPAVVWQNHELTDPSNKIQIASIDTLIRRDWPEYDVLIVDEAHIKRESLLKAIESTDKPVIGLTATPFTAWLGTYYKSFIKTKTPREMMELGYLSDYVMYGSHQKPDMSDVKVTRQSHGRDYDQKQLGNAMTDIKLVGDIVSNWLEKGCNEPTIAFCVNVSHANAVTINFQKAGVTAEVITAKTPQEERQEIFKRFRDGVTKILVSVGCLIAGFDEDVRCVIYARPTKSEMLYQQALGRGWRLADGKEHCIILEHSGTWMELGQPCLITIDDLKSSSNGDSKTYERDEEPKKEKKPKECTKCHFIKPAGVYECPKCGFKPIAGEDVETIDAELEVVSGKNNKKKMTTEEKQFFYSELLGFYNQKILEGKTWNRHWVANQYKAKTGVWPRGLNDEPLEPSLQTLNWIKSQWIRFHKAKGTKKYANSQGGRR